VSGSIVKHLVRKDLRLHRVQITLTIAAGIAALAIVARGGEVPFVIGVTWFFVAIIVLACMLPVTAIVNERKKQTLAFLMSLPLSSIEYTTAKLVSTLLMFLAPWLMLLICALVLLTMRGVAGAIPMLLILAILPLIGFSLILAVALVSESEGWAIAATVVCNSSYGITWYLMSRVPSLTANWTGHVAIFSPPVLRVLAVEVGIIVLLGALTFFFQSRKRDFI
jgi:ABC-2 type transport system permease protein